MDPAAGVSSPFHNDLGKNSRMDHALEELTAAASVRGVNGTQNGSVKPVGSKRPRGNETTSHGTSCGRCGKIYPMKEVPAGGMYLCTKCAKEYLSESEGRHFPPNTLKCCPASVTEGSGGVVRCHACHGWYHCECLDIHDKSLKDYISLSTTKCRSGKHHGMTIGSAAGYVMISLVLLCCISLEYARSDSTLLLGALGHPLRYAFRASENVSDVVNGALVEALWDWHVLRGPRELRFRVVLLLQPGNKTQSEYIGPSLAALSDIDVQCGNTQTSADASNTAATVTHASKVVQFLYVCGGGATATLRAAAAHWQNGAMTKFLDEPVLSLGAARSWHLPPAPHGTLSHLLYVLTSDGATTAVLLEADGLTVGNYPLHVTKLQLPQRSDTRDVKLISSCFLPGIGLSGLIQYSEVDGVSHFELHRIFSSAPAAELLLETSSAVFSELSTEERLSCSLSSRIVFTRCTLTFSGSESLRVAIALTATIESPVAGGAGTLGGWMTCGETTLTGSAQLRESGSRVHVSPLQRAHFTPVQAASDYVEGEEVNSSTVGRMGRCVFYIEEGSNESDEINPEGHVDCSASTESLRAAEYGISATCAALRAWWNLGSAFDECLCESFGVSSSDLLFLFITIFIVTCGVQLAAYFFPR